MNNFKFDLKNVRKFAKILLMKADVLAKSIDKNVKDGEKIIYLSPKGKLFNHQLAKQLSQEKTINIICGHFEGVDERLLKTRTTQSMYNLNQH